VFLARRLPSLSRSQIQRLIKTGHVTAADHPIKTSAPVTAGLAVRVIVPLSIVMLILLGRRFAGPAPQADARRARAA